jgi:hypothetical protein
MRLSVVGGGIPQRLDLGAPHTGKNSRVKKLQIVRIAGLVMPYNYLLLFVVGGKFLPQVERLN